MSPQDSVLTPDTSGEPIPGVGSSPVPQAAEGGAASGSAPRKDGADTSAGNGTAPETPKGAVPVLARQPRTARALRDQVYALASQVWEQKSRHEVIAGRWSVVGGWTRLVVALAASLSTVSVLSKNETAAIVFSVSTAVISALNAAYSPADTAKAHHAAASRFARSWRRLDDMLYVFDSNDDGTIYIADTPYTPDGEPYDAGYYATGFRLTREDLGPLTRQLADIQAEIEATQDAAPPLNQLRTRTSVFQRALPESFWGLLRYRRALRYAAKARRYQQETWRTWQPETPAPPPVPGATSET